MPKKNLHVWFEFASTYSHVGVLRIEAAAAAEGVTIAWRPFLLGPIFKSQGWMDSPFNLFPAKGAYMQRDMQRLCDKHRLPWRWPSTFPRNGLLAARVATAAEGQPWLGDFVRGVYRANFAEDREIADPECLGAVLNAAGCPTPDALLDLASTQETKTRLRERTEEASRLGIFGAPTLVVDDEVFWGQDRIEDAIEWALRG